MVNISLYKLSVLTHELKDKCSVMSKIALSRNVRYHVRNKLQTVRKAVQNFWFLAGLILA